MGEPFGLKAIHSLRYLSNWDRGIAARLVRYSDPIIVRSPSRSKMRTRQSIASNHQSDTVGQSARFVHNNVVERGSVDETSVPIAREELPRPAEVDRCADVPLVTAHSTRRPNRGRSCRFHEP